MRLPASRLVLKSTFVPTTALAPHLCPVPLSSPRLCPAGTFSARPGALSCSVCADGTTTLAPGAAACAVPPARPEPDGGGLQYALVLYFRMMLNVGQVGKGRPRAAHLAALGGCVPG